MLVRPPHELRLKPVATLPIVLIHSQVELHREICASNKGERKPKKSNMVNLNEHHTTRRCVLSRAKATQWNEINFSGQTRLTYCLEVQGH